jgi:hypothetical protein
VIYSDVSDIPGEIINGENFQIGKPYAHFALKPDGWEQDGVVRFETGVERETVVSGRTATEDEPLIGVSYGYALDEEGMIVNFAKSSTSVHAVPAKNLGLVQSDTTPTAIIVDIGLTLAQRR